MVNGQTARVTRYLIATLLCVSLVGILILSLAKVEVPNVYEFAVYTGFGFLVGTNFSNGSKTQEKMGPETPLEK